MSTLTAESRQLLDILTAIITSHDNDTIRQAENLLYQLLDQHVEKVIESLLILMNPQTVHDVAIPVYVRSLCVVLLTKHLPKGEEDLMSRLPDALQVRVKNDLFTCLYHETNADLSRHFIHCIVAVAEVQLFKDEWSELYPFLFNCISTPVRPEIRLHCLYIISLLTTNCFESLNIHLLTVERILLDCFNDNSMLTKQYAITCLCKILGEVVLPEARQAFRKLCPFIQSVIKECIQTHQYENLKSVMLQLITVTSDSHELYFFKPYQEEFIDVIGKIIGMSDVPDQIRQFSLEFLVSIILEEPALCSKIKYRSLLSTVMTGCCQLMMTISSDWSEWVSNSGSHGLNLEDDENEANYHTAFDAVGRIGEVIKGKIQVAQVFPVLKSLFARPDWRFKYTAMSCLLQLIGSVTLGQFPCQDIFHLINNSNIRVRYIAIQFVGTASEFYAPHFQSGFHQIVLPMLLKCGSEHNVHILHEQVCISLVSFISQCNDTLLSHYSDNLMSMLLHFLMHGSVAVQKETISAIATLAGANTEVFMKYYSQIMVHLRQLLVSPQNQNEIQLRCKAIEGISYIGLAVGKEMFYNDAKMLVEFFLSLQGSNVKLSNDDDADQYLQCAMARICPILGTEFSPCLPFIIPPLLEAIVHEPNSSLKLRTNNTEPIDEYSNPLLKMKQATKQIIDSIEDKTVMVSMLETFVTELKELYYPYLFTTLRTVVKYLDYAQSDELQQHVMQLLPSLVKCSIASLRAHSDPNSVDVNGVNIQQAVYALIVECIQYILPCILKQSNNIQLLEQLSSLYDILTTLLEEQIICFDQAMVTSIVEEFLRTAADASERIKLRFVSLDNKKYLSDIHAEEVEDDKYEGAETTHANANTEDGVHNSTLTALTQSKITKLNISDCYIVEQMFEVMAILAKLVPHGFYTVFEQKFAEILLFTYPTNLPEIKRNPFILYAALFQCKEDILSPSAVEAILNVCVEQFSQVGQGNVLERAAYTISCCIDRYTGFFGTSQHILTRCTSTLVSALSSNLVYLNSKELEELDNTRELERIHMDEEEVDSTTQFLFTSAGTSKEMLLYAIDNMTCVLGKIVFLLNVPSVLPNYLQGLPIKVDVGEGDKTYTMLCNQVTQQNLFQHLDSPTIATIVQILCTAVVEEDRDELVRAHLCEALAYITQLPNITSHLSAIPQDNQTFVKDTFQKALQFVSTK